MFSITPCRTLISERFPVASFVVKVPNTRCFEVACATDPQLFGTESRERRTPANFFSTRGSGLLRAPTGETTVMVPPDQLCRFAGAQRLYYALGSYEDQAGADPRFTIHSNRPADIPFIQISSDFTGRALDRSRLRGVAAEPDTYGGRGGGRGATPGWGGDLAYPKPAPTPAPTIAQANATPGYDDGFDPSLWNNRQSSADGPNYGYVVDPTQVLAARQDYPAVEPPVSPGPLTRPGPHADDYDSVPTRPVTNPPASRPARSAGDAGPDNGQRHAPHYDGPSEPGGYPDPAALRAAMGLAYGGTRASARAVANPVQPSAEPTGFEDASELRLRTASPAPSGPAYGSRAPAGIPLTPREMTRIVRPVFRLSGGLDGYARADADDRGLVWGMAGFNQRDGSLRDVLQAAWRRDQSWYASSGQSHFEAVFGQRGATDLQEYIHRGEPEAWMAPVGGQSLDSRQWMERFAQAGARHREEASGQAIPIERDPFKVAQNEVAIQRHLVPALPLARELGFRTDRSLSILYDRTVHMGTERAGRWFRETLHEVDDNGDVKARLERVVGRAESEGRPWSERLRALLENTTDLNDTVYDLDA